MNIHTGEIQLAPYKEKYKEVIQTFTLPSEQVQFTSDPSALLEKAKVIIQKCDCYFRSQWGTGGSFRIGNGR